MNVIRHDHIATYCDVEGLLGALGKKNEPSVNLILCQEPLSFVRAERDEIKRTCCEDPSQTSWSPSESPLHCAICRHWVVDRRNIFIEKLSAVNRPQAGGYSYRAIVSARSSSSFPAFSKFMMH